MALDILFILANGDKHALRSVYRRSVDVRGENHPDTIKIRQALGG